MKITKKLKETIRRELQLELAILGGKARAAKHGKAKLRAWGKLGGRPRKKRARRKKR